MTERYVRPGRTASVFNRMVAMFTRAGVSVWGSQVLEVRGRSTGELRSTPVNPLTFHGSRYLVSPRGTTHWVRNLRVAGEGVLRVGRRTERFRAVEITDDEKPEILREYLRRWKREVGSFFDAGPDATADDLRRIAPDHPVFRLEPASPRW